MLNTANTDKCLYKQWSDKANIHLNTLAFIICLVLFMKTFFFLMQFFKDFKLY